MVNKVINFYMVPIASRVFSAAAELLVITSYLDVDSDE